MFLPSSLLLAPAASGLASLAAAEAEGNPWWLWIVVFLILAAFGAFMLWWWLRSPDEEGEIPGPPARSEAAPAHSPEIAASPETAGPPETETEAAVTESGAPPADDLQIVEGIGPKIAAVLGDAGITTFSHLASLDPERLRQILGDRDPNLLRLADPTTWPEQARLAAEGEWEALAGYQRELKGGRHA